MTEQARRMTLAVLSAAAVLTGCEPVPGSDVSVGDVLSGEWSACIGGAADQRKTIVFYPDASYLLATETFGTSDGTCGGAATGARYESWTYRLGTNVAAAVGTTGTTVTAREINSWNALKTVYSIVYQEAATSPARLYFGDLTLDPALDGTAETKRPDVLSSTSPLLGQ